MVRKWIVEKKYICTIKNEACNDLSYLYRCSSPKCDNCEVYLDSKEKVVPEKKASYKPEVIVLVPPQKRDER